MTQFSTETEIHREIQRLKKLAAQTPYGSPNYRPLSDKIAALQEQQKSLRRIQAERA